MKPMAPNQISMAILSIALASLCHADSIVIEQGHQRVTLVEVHGTIRPVLKAMDQKHSGKARRRNLGSLLGLGVKQYWIRLREIDGELVCEKFGMIQPRWSQERAYQWANELLAKPCD